MTPTGLVDIETIQIGDLVMAWREDGSGYGAYPVTALIRPPSRTIWQLRLLDAEGNLEIFETTDDHPWHETESAMFVRTDGLEAGMVLSTQDGDGVTVLFVDKTADTAPTYNLTVGDAHTFFVGDDGIWVHNVDCSADAFEASLNKLSPGERVAKVRTTLNEVATENGWARARDIERRNPGRTIYRDADGNLYSVDTQHGRFEKTNRRGRHQGEQNIDGSIIDDSIDPSGGHDLNV